MSTWLLPESVADVLPIEARRIEDLRRVLLDCFRTYGYEFVIPPLLEYTDSLLGQADQSLDLQTFKLLDQQSGRLLGIRSDTTPQVARIDAHLLNRQGPARLCYCGPTLQTKARGLHSTREPLQCGAELYGCSGLEADLEVISLATQVLQLANISGFRLALSHAGLVKAILADKNVSPIWMRLIHQALAQKDSQQLAEVSQHLSKPFQEQLAGILNLYGFAGGSDCVLARARKEFSTLASVRLILDQLQQVIDHIRLMSPDLEIMVDLADLASFNYHSGLIFSAYCDRCPNPILRGGRYDNVGQIYGRSRPATGFSVDLRELVSLSNNALTPTSAIRAPWGSDQQLVAKIVELRQQGETVVQVLSHSFLEQDEFICDREIKQDSTGHWVVVSLR